MKDIKKIICCVVKTCVLVTIFSSCKDFLDVTPRNKKVVRTVEDERDILGSYIYFMKTFNREQISIMGIDPYAYPKFDVAQTLSLYTGESKMAQFSFLYDSQKRMYTTLGVYKMSWLESNEEIWERYYRFLGGINMIISSIDHMECDDEHMKDYVKGEALSWRAYAYYKLLQYYSPYNNAELGIPIYEDPSDDIGNAMPARKTQKEVFDFIIKDCHAALSLLTRTPTNSWNYIYREDFINAMLASVYLWKSGSSSAENKDFANAELHATKAIGQRNLISDINEFKKIFDCSKAMINVPITSPEFYIRITDDSRMLFSSDAYRLNYLGSSITSGVANMDYYNLYKDNDKRKSFYFYTTPENVIMNDKYNISGYELDRESAGCLMPFRLAEMYLIKAEVLARMGKTTEALNVLNRFRASRYDKSTDFKGDNSSILKEILMERKREFLLENDMLWLDMKRLGVSMEREINGEKRTLAPNDFKYTFPIPKRELKNNKNIKQAPEWDKYNY